MRSFDVPTAIVVAGGMLLLWLALWLQRRLRRRGFISPVDQATYSTLHRASLAARHLSTGLSSEAGDKAGKHLLALLGARALAITDRVDVLSWTGPGETLHRPLTMAVNGALTGAGRTWAGDHREVNCSDPECELRSAVFVPLVLGDDVIGSLAAYTDSASPGLVRATEEVAAWVSAQLELAQSSRDRPRLMEAELRALRAQISPHFIYNALAAIASFVRTDRIGPVICCSSSPTSRYAASRRKLTTLRRNFATSSATWSWSSPLRRATPGQPAHRARGAVGQGALRRFNPSWRTRSGTDWRPRKGSAM